MSAASVALDDQADAAEREADAALAPFVSCDIPITESETPLFMNAIARTSLASLTGGLTVCCHVRGDAPIPLYADLPAPTVLYCARCCEAANRRFAAVRKGTPLADTCEGCHRIKPGRLNEIYVRAGFVTYLGVLCDQCADAAETGAL